MAFSSRNTYEEAPPECTEYGWSTSRFSNTSIPSYLPPEIFLIENGRALEAVLARARLNDMKRLIETGQESSYFISIPITSHFSDTPFSPSAAICERKTAALKEVFALRKYRDRLLAARNDQTTSVYGCSDNRQVIDKYYFKPEQMEHYGTLFGGRGETHKKLLKESRCLKIEYAGKGITNSDKKINQLRGEDESANDRPHAKIVAPDERAFNKAVELIEWWLSDDPKAVQAREDNRRRLAIQDGRYDPGRDGAFSSYKNKKAAEKRERDEDDEELDELLADV
eukprot:Tbor_TRINITY_DN3176_c0_g1::TRINITY_DN3176_c0_g1_i1::g.14744::m.14744